MGFQTQCSPDEFLKKLTFLVSSLLVTNGDHHRVAAKNDSKVERGRPATSVHGFVRHDLRRGIPGCLVRFVIPQVVVA